MTYLSTNDTWVSRNASYQSASLRTSTFRTPVTLPPLVTPPPTSRAGPTRGKCRVGLDWSGRERRPSGQVSSLTGPQG